MKVFATRFFEEPSKDSITPNSDWSWNPINHDVNKIYASGANTQSRSSTYAAEKDNRDDDDRPNEGMFVA